MHACSRPLSARLCRFGGGTPAPLPLTALQRRASTLSDVRRLALQVVANAKGGKGFGELLRRNTAKKGLGPNPSSTAVRESLTPGKLSPMSVVPDSINRPPYAVGKGKPPVQSNQPEIQDAEGILKMRAAGKLASEVLQHAGSMLKAGMTTNDIDLIVHEMTIAAGAYPSPLNYSGFPKSVCTSLNECICHGIPDTTVIQDGDILNIDVTVYLDGYHGDTSRTFLVGDVSAEAAALVAATKESLDRAIAVCKPGASFQEIGKAIHDLADEKKLGVVRSFVGHGVGKMFHSGPAVLHYRNNERYPAMQVGQTFTIEPMLTLGSTRERYWKDNWTAVTTDGSWTAQFEHTLLITDTGVDILTAYE